MKEAAFQLCTSLSLVDQSQNVDTPHQLWNRWSKQCSAFPLCMANVNSWSDSESTCRHALSALKQMLKQTALQLHVNSWSESKCRHALSALKQMMKEAAFQLHVNVTSWSKSTCWHALSALKQKLKEMASELCMSISYLWWEFMYFVFTCIPGESCPRWLRSLLSLCDVFRMLITSLVCSSLFRLPLSGTTFLLPSNAAVFSQFKNFS